jgi:phosphoribosyl-ATP pyrophosphohydrolase/phosphoribosyl-AMP cyclohydrolase
VSDDVNQRNFKHVKFDDHGLIPAVVQDWRDGSVLMLGFMNQAALAKTLEAGSVHFWSRSRQTLWEKGETSGHRLAVKELFLDCDADTLLVKAEPVGPACHTGQQACFFTRVHPDGSLEARMAADAGGGILERIAETIESRRSAASSDSYVAALLQGGADRILKKVVEEAGEVVLASKDGKSEAIIHEVADLLFHTLVVLGYHRIPLAAVYQQLAARFGKSGLRSGKRQEEA